MPGIRRDRVNFFISGIHVFRLASIRVVGANFVGTVWHWWLLNAAECKFHATTVPLGNRSSVCLGPYILSAEKYRFFVFKVADVIHPLLPFGYSSGFCSFGV